MVEVELLCEHESEVIQNKDWLLKASGMFVIETTKD